MAVTRLRKYNPTNPIAKEYFQRHIKKRNKILSNSFLKCNLISLKGS